MRQLAMLSVLLAGNALACDLKIDSAWIREAPGSATTLAGYAVLSNAGNQSVTLASVRSAAFAQVQMHESLTENGIAKMRAIDQLQIPARGKVEFSPIGKHFMLIGPKNALRGGDSVVLKFSDATGCETTASFKVTRTAPGASGMDHSTMDHSH